MLTYAEAVVVGVFQGVTELFPVSSLGHSVLVPALIGGQWARDLNVSAPESPYLAFIVGLHVATAAALLLFFWRDWVAIVAGFISSVRYRRIDTLAERLAWLILLATPVILAAGLLKIPDLFGPLGQGIGGQVLAGSIASFVSAYLAVRFLMRYFETRTLTPFAIYCTLAGLGSLVWLTIR